LPECVERLLARLRVHALHRLDLVEHDDEPRVARLPEELQQAGEERKRRLAVDLALGARRLEHAAVRVRLPREPRQEALRGGEVALVRGPVVGTEHLREGRVALREVRELVFEPLLRRVGEARVVLVDAAQPRDLVAHLVEPAFDDGLERVGTVGGRLELLDEAAVHRLQMVQRRVVDRDLHLAREHALARLRAQVARGEGLAGAVLAANPLRETLALRDEVEVLVHRTHEPIEPGGEVFESRVRHEARAERVDDGCGLRDDGHQRPSFCGW
jgi:hypothetical protein